MHPFAIVQLVASLAAVMLAVALLAINSKQRANRLVAIVLLCSAHWSLCEVFWSLSDDPRRVLQWVRLSSLGWMWLGPLTLHIISELVGGANTGLRRALPWAYACAVASILLYVATPWCLAEPVRTSLGWGVRFGPLFPLVYLPTAVSTGFVIAQWPSLFPPTVSPGERREARWLLAGILAPLAVASVTDALLPLLAIDVPRLGSMSLLALGAIVAGSVRRHGYFLLAPGAFARPILETLRDGVVLLHPDGRIRTCNEAFARLVGIAPAELADAAVYQWLPGLARDCAAASRGVELDLRPQASAPMPVSVSASPLHDEQRDVIGRVLAVRDLREVAALRNRLITSGRLAAVGELAAGIAQEIDEPVTDVRANLIELREQWRALAVGVDARDELLAPVLIEGADLIEESGEGVERVATIVREVSAFSQAGLGAPQLASVNDLLENAVNVAALSFSVVVERCYAELPPVRCDAQQLRQVFLNLLLNALQAVGDFGVIRLVTEAQGDFVRIRVEDDGCGIPEDQIERIFDPFFTTRRTGTAAGLGLAHCYQIVRHHGGEITVTSKVGVGSTFCIRLPV
ncbi:MAG TPA: ATP-binding protein [Myxococcota bacterium]|jgi:signal transduction histidine kinase